MEIQLRRSWILSALLLANRTELPPGSHDFQFRNSGLALLGGDPGNAILLNGVMQTANLEIGAPGLQPQVPTSTSEFRFMLPAPQHRYHHAGNGHGASLNFGCGQRQRGVLSAHRGVGVSQSGSP